MPNASSPSEGQPTPQQAPAPQAAPKSNKAVFILTIILVAIICLAAGAAAYYFYENSDFSKGKSSDNASQSGNSSEESEQEADDDAADAEEADEEEEEELAEPNWTGDSVEAILPDGWTIQEYYDGAGSDMLVSGVAYTGLTGLTVTKPGGTVVFEMGGVYGIGGTDACMEYFEFPDSSVAFHDEVFNDSAVEGVVPTVITIADGDYVEYSFLGLRVRRVGTDIYWDAIDGNASFDAACGIMQHFISPADLSFSGDGTAIGNYEIQIVNAPSEAELNTLDGILNHILPL